VNIIKKIIYKNKLKNLLNNIIFIFLINLFKYKKIINIKINQLILKIKNNKSK
jgi:hypothetical protein